MIKPHMVLSRLLGSEKLEKARMLFGQSRTQEEGEPVESRVCQGQAGHTGINPYERSRVVVATFGKLQRSESDKPAAVQNTYFEAT